MTHVWSGAALALLLCSAALVPIAGEVRRQAAGGSNHDWAVYLGDNARAHYSPLTQINRSNVAGLKVAWSYDTGDRGEYQANNLIVRGVLYTPSPTRKVIALDAATGNELWKWDPVTERPGAGGGRQRGLAYWENSTGGEARIFTGVGNFLYALDPKTGTVIRSFARTGRSTLAPAPRRLPARHRPRSASTPRPDLQRHVHRRRQHEHTGNHSRL